MSSPNWTNNCSISNRTVVVDPYCQSASEKERNLHYFQLIKVLCLFATRWLRNCFKFSMESYQWIEHVSTELREHNEGLRHLYFADWSYVTCYESQFGTATCCLAMDSNNVSTFSIPINGVLSTMIQMVLLSNALI